MQYINVLVEFQNTFLWVLLVTPSFCQCTSTASLITTVYQRYLLWFEKSKWSVTSAPLLGFLVELLWYLGTDIKRSVMSSSNNFKLTKVYKEHLKHDAASPPPNLAKELPPMVPSEKEAGWTSDSFWTLQIRETSLFPEGNRNTSTLIRFNYQLDAIFFYFSSTCFGLIRPSSGAIEL